MDAVRPQRPDPLLRVEIGPVAEASVGDLARVVAARRDLHALAGDMHMADARLVLQDRDVLERRAVDRDEIGEAPGSNTPTVPPLAMNRR